MTTLVSTVDRLGLRLPDGFNDISLGYRPDWLRRALIPAPFMVYVGGPTVMLAGGADQPGLVAGYALAALLVPVAAGIGSLMRNFGDGPLGRHEPSVRQLLLPAVPDVDPVPPDLRTSAVGIRDRWPEIMRQLYQLPLDDDLSSVPVLLGVQLEPFGFSVWVQTRPGQDGADVRALEPRLGSLLARPVSVLRADQTMTIFGVKFADPLAEPVKLASTATTSASVLGRAEDGAAVLWSPPDDLSHLAIQGQSRSGKSSLLYGVVAQLRARRQLVVGIDPAGNLFKRWPGQSLPSGESTSALIANSLRDTSQLRRVLEGLLTLLDERLASLARSPGDKFAPDDPDHPPVFVVLDEFAGLVSTVKTADQTLGKDEKLSPLLETVKNRLLAEGLKVNLVLVISTQRFDASILGGAARSNIRTRVTLRVDNLDAMKMLHESIPEETRAAIPSFPPGRAVVEGASDSFELREMQSPFTPFTEYQRALGSGGDARP